MEKNIEEKLNQEIKNSKNAWNNRNSFSFKLSDSEIRQIFATKHEVNMNRDENGIPIPGTGRVITNEEKKAVFDFILENSYPLTRKVYDIILHAYLDNEVELSVYTGPKL